MPEMWRAAYLDTCIIFLLERCPLCSVWSAVRWEAGLHRPHTLAALYQDRCPYSSDIKATAPQLREWILKRLIEDLRDSSRGNASKKWIRSYIETLRVMKLTRDPKISYMVDLWWNQTPKWLKKSEHSFLKIKINIQTSIFVNICYICLCVCVPKVLYLYNFCVNTWKNVWIFMDFISWVQAKLNIPVEIEK